MKKIIQNTLQLTVAALLLGSTANVYSHELRNLCGSGNIKGAACDGQPNTLRMVVGFLTEPAFDTEINGLDFNLSFYTDAAHTLLEEVNTAKGDEVHLHAETEILFLKNATQDWSKKNVIKHAALRIPTDALGNVAQKYGTTNKYPTYFRTTKPGVYGFHLVGHAKHNGTEIEFDEYFICGGGSQSATSRFNCVQKPLAFP
ncbi:MAG: hypothetical protein PHE55_08750 [Methylococcaceae bacterium]|nr:hypothetical protein [Methylococcaceae bacterium]